jgi:Flp pilus assembly protein TadD
LLAQAVREHQAGNFAQAEQLYRRVLGQDPGQAEALNLFGALAVQTGKPDVAIDYIGRALRVDGANPVYHYNLGLAQQATAKRDAAIASYRQALRLRPDYVAALANLGGLLLNKGEIEDALTCYRKVVRLAPENAMARANLGAGLLVREQWDEAIICFRKALRLKPGYADAHNGLSAAFLAQERYGEAASSANEALRCDPAPRPGPRQSRVGAGGQRPLRGSHHRFSSRAATRPKLRAAAPEPRQGVLRVGQPCRGGGMLSAGVADRTRKYPGSPQPRQAAFGTQRIQRRDRDL